LVPIDSLTPHPDNPNQGDVGAIMESIACNGFNGAVIVSRRADADVIVAGEHRWRALLALQLDGWFDPDGELHPYDTLPHVPPLGWVPIVPIEGLSVTGERRFLIADNRTTDLSSYDDAALAAILTDLAATDTLLGTVYDGDALDELLASLTPPEPEPPKQRSPVTCPKCGHEWVPTAPA
jgi:hypothetical protein